MSADDQHRPANGPGRWHGVPVMAYKADGEAPFSGVTRQRLFALAELAAELRYFEVAASGHTTLERHRHVHAVMILHGRGHCLLGERVIDLAPHDLVTIPPMTWHQFRAPADAPLGFLCLVNAERDRPQLPGADDLAALCQDPRIAAFIRS